MDTRTGEIFSPEVFEKMKEELLPNQLKNYKRMNIQPTKLQMNRKPPRVGRNEPCPCDSGNKFKKCCLNKEDKE
jgi:uncharacterized protein YecA (UPF0149 family)